MTPANPSTANVSVIARLREWHSRGFSVLAGWLAPDFLPLLARLTLAGVFWRSLLTKVETVGLLTYTDYINDFAVERSRLKLPAFPLELKPAALAQFRNDFALPVLPPEAAAWMAVLAEFAFPLLLLAGLFTRLSALALLGMTLVIQIFVFPQAWWGTHALWTVMALYLVVQGPGRISLDTLTGRFFAR